MARSKAASLAKSGDSRQYIIQLNARHASLDSLRSRLEKIGVNLDPEYGPINVNPVERNYVVRGWATPDARARAEKIEGVTFFGDAKIAPTR